MRTLSYKEAEELILSQPPLHLENEFIPVDEDNSGRNWYVLRLLRAVRKFKTLYKDGSVQCWKDKDRSLGDLFLLCRTHFRPYISLAEFHLDLKCSGAYSLMCPNIDKRVYVDPAKYEGKKVWDINEEDEYGWRWFETPPLGVEETKKQQLFYKELDI